MSVKKAVLYVKGKSLQLKVNGVSGKTVWSSANKKIVKVSSKGKITAVKTGTTVVKAKIGKNISSQTNLNRRKIKPGEFLHQLQPRFLHIKQGKAIYNHADIQHQA